MEPAGQNERDDSKDRRQYQYRRARVFPRDHQSGRQRDQHREEADSERGRGVDAAVRRRQVGMSGEQP